MRRKIKWRNLFIFIIIFTSFIFLLSQVKEIIDIFAKENDLFPIFEERVSNEKSDITDTILVNKNNPLPENYQVDLIQLENGESVSDSIYPSLMMMFNDLREEGYDPFVRSGYRDKTEQVTLFEDKVKELIDMGYGREDAYQETLNWVAEPGTSEHETGLAIDINDEGNFLSNQEMYIWLENNSYRYGFILRYPEEKTDITGVSYEPWHFRFVGKEVASEIKNNNLTLEEYLQE